MRESGYYRIRLKFGGDWEIALWDYNEDAKKFAWSVIGCEYTFDDNELHAIDENRIPKHLK